MKLPKLTHLQFLVLSLLLDSDQSGQDLRDGLKKHGVKKSGPGFYQFMARLEDAGFVKGWYDVEVINGLPLKRRMYRLLGHGRSAWGSTQEFYASRFVGRRGVATA